MIPILLTLLVLLSICRVKFLSQPISANFQFIFRISNFFVTSISGEQEFESDDADTIDRTSTSEDDDSEALIAAVTDAIRYFFLFYLILSYLV